MINTIDKEAVEEKIKIENGLPVQVLSHITHSEKNELPVFYHYHNYIEIIYALEGVHKAWVSGSLHTFSSGDLVLINSGYVHGFTYGKGVSVCLRFDPDIIYNSQKNAVGLKYILPFILNCSKHTSIFRKKDIENSGIPDLIMKIHEEYSEKPYGYEFASQIMINEIYLWFLRFWHSHHSGMSFNDPAETSAKWLHKVLSYVNENYSQPITALDMANLCNMSYSYFSRSFKKIMQKSFSEYLAYVRINEAEKLLLTTDMNITEIALQVGFSTSSYFIQQFKSLKSISPKQYKLNFES